MVLCDLPYGTTRNKWDSVIDLDHFWEQVWRVAKQDAAVVLTAQTPFDKVLGCSQLKYLRYEWIWEKGNASGHLNAKRAPLKAHENVLVFYRKQPTYNPQKTSGHVRKVSSASHRRGTRLSDNYGDVNKNYGYDSTDRFPRSTLFFSSDKQKSKIHPTQKPVALFEYLIRTYTNPGELVLDACMGSGTTAVAALASGRNYVGFETDETYFNASIQRIAEVGSPHPTLI